MPTKADHKRSYANRLGFIQEHGGAPAKPVNTEPPTITGDAEVGGVLTYVPGDWTGRPAPSVSAVWQKDGADDGSAWEPRALTEDDVGAVFRVREDAMNMAGGTTVFSAATDAVTEA